VLAITLLYPAQQEIDEWKEYVFHERGSITDMREMLIQKVRELVYTKDMDSIDVLLVYDEEKIEGFTIKHTFRGDNKKHVCTSMGVTGNMNGNSSN
jgi:hypothetical protein